MYIHIYIYIYIDVNIYIYMHAYIYIHTHKYISYIYCRLIFIFIYRLITVDIVFILQRFFYSFYDVSFTFSFLVHSADAFCHVSPILLWCGYD